jgi:hypothetical protein
MENFKLSKDEINLLLDLLRTSKRELQKEQKRTFSSDVAKYFVEMDLKITTELIRKFV